MSIAPLRDGTELFENCITWPRTIRNSPFWCQSNTVKIQSRGSACPNLHPAAGAALRLRLQDSVWLCPSNYWQNEAKFVLVGQGLGYLGFTRQDRWGHLSVDPGSRPSATPAMASRGGRLPMLAVLTVCCVLVARLPDHQCEPKPARSAS